MPSSSPSVIIAGAGIAGLACAWWLNHIGWRVTLVEKAPHLRDGGYMMGLSGPGLLAARRMGLVEALRAVEYDIHENLYRDRHGRVITRIRYRELLENLEWIILRRTDLVRVLRDALPSRMDVRLATTLTLLDTRPDGVTVRLSDGSDLEADLLIGADGAHSALRRQLFPDDEHAKEYLGYRYAAYDAADNLGVERDFVSFAAVGQQAEYHGLGEQRLAALHLWRSEEHGPVAADRRLPLLRALARDTHPLVARMLDGLDEGTPIIMDDLSMITLPRWHQGRVLLVGDAAHNLSLVSGQGAGMAMASAAVLARALSEASIEDALTRHEQALRPVIERLQQRSRRLAPVYVPRSAGAFWLRNTVMRWVPRPLLKRYFMSGLKSEAQAAEALELPAPADLINRPATPPASPSRSAET